MREVSLMLKAIHAQESKKAAREKARAVVEELRAMKLKAAAKKVETGIEETLTYCEFPTEHWTRIRTNNAIERLNREIRRRTRVVGCFPDGNSALMLVCVYRLAATPLGVYGAVYALLMGRAVSLLLQLAAALPLLTGSAAPAGP